MTLSAQDQKFLDLAIDQAQIGWDEGGVPSGATLVRNAGSNEAEVLAVGRNRRVQMQSATRHGETDCLESAGTLPSSVYRECTLYTTLSPCNMCAGAAIHYGIPRVVIGENRNFEVSERWLLSNGVELVIADDERCVALMDRMVRERSDVWAADIGAATARL